LTELLYETSAGPLRIQVIERSGQLGLYFLNREGTLDGPMSRIDPARPFFLLGEYTQAMMLCLLWNPTPARIAMLGFGGGRISCVLHHHLPDLMIDNLDIHAVFGEIATRFFAIQFDQRQRLHIADARQFIETANTAYQCILIDAFSDQDENLNHLGSYEFFRICQKRLSPGGVVAMNILRSDPHCAAKAAAFDATFRFTSVVPLKHSLVLFGGGYGKLTNGQVRRRATELQARYQFESPFESHAARLIPFRLEDHGLVGTPMLRDLPLSS
jgi:spermidine synthase